MANVIHSECCNAFGNLQIHYSFAQKRNNFWIAVEQISIMINTIINDKRQWRQHCFLFLAVTLLSFGWITRMELETYHTEMTQNYNCLSSRSWFYIFKFWNAYVHRKYNFYLQNRLNYQRCLSKINYVNFVSPIINSTHHSIHQGVGFL